MATRKKTAAGIRKSSTRIPGLDAMTGGTAMRGKAQVELPTSEDHYKTIVENAMDGIALVDADTYRLLFANPVFCQMLGYAPEEIAALSVMDLHPAEDVPEALREFDRHVEGKTENFRVKRRDGSVFYADITVAYFESQGRRHVAGFFRDITGRRQAEQLIRERQAEFTAIVEHSPSAMIVTTGLDQQVVVANQKFTDLFGYTKQDVPDARNWWVLAYPDEQYRAQIETEWTRRIVAAIESGGKIEPMEAVVACKDRSKRYVRFSFSSTGSTNIVTFEDLTERRKMEQALQESEARYRSIFESVDDCIYTCEADGTLSSISPSFERMTGWSPQEWLGRHFTPLVHPDDLPRMLAVFGKLLAGETVPANEVRLKTKAGTYLDAEFKSVPIRRGDAVVIGGILRDITERKRVEKLLRALATTDALTGLANRGEFTRLLEKEMERARRYGSPLSLVMYDLDHFKRVNDEFGHDAGDEVLRTVSRVAKESIRSSDVAARWGGEEFMVLTPQSDLAAANRTAEKLREAIARHHFDTLGKVTVSVGVVQCSPGEDAPALLKRVDEALYRAKARGRNCVEMSAA
jgi:diguanylate cyclase (GGDEF)-like protein/PAS domain S-box-containing protein